MSKGHVFLAENNKTTNYIRQAYALALSIKLHNKEHNQTCLITNDFVPDEYKHAFDYILPIPWRNSAINTDWKIENRWKTAYVTPFEENLVYDVDMLLTKTNDHWWKHLNGLDLAFTTDVCDYANNVITSNFYRKTFVTNNLPNIYTGVFYFRKSDLAYDFFTWVKLIIKNWKVFYSKYLISGSQDFCSFDVSAALALKLMGHELPKTPILTFTHMKPAIQGWKKVPSKWTNVLDANLSNNGSILIGNILQTNVLHYVEDEFLTDTFIEKMVNAND